MWGWSLEDQERALVEAGKWEPGRVFEDVLPEIKAKKPSFIKPEWLTEREALLRGNGRRTGEEIAVASLTVLAPNETDLISVIRMARGRRATIFAADSGFSVVSHEAMIEDIEAAVKEWHRAKGAAKTKPGRTLGYLAAAAKKNADTDVKLHVARPLWRSRKWDRPSVDEIATLSDLSPKTLYNRLHERPQKERKPRGK